MEIADPSPALTTKLELFLSRPYFSSLSRLANSQLLCLLLVGIFLTMLCSFSLFFSSFSFMGPEKLHWGSGQLRYLLFILSLLLLAITRQCFWYSLSKARV